MEDPGEVLLGNRVAAVAVDAAGGRQRFEQLGKGRFGVHASLPPAAGIRRATHRPLFYRETIAQRGRNVTNGWPLEGLRVLDLSTEIAGPYATKLLVDAGADVVKVEAPGAGDPLRRWTASGTALPEAEDGALFRFLNASKRSIALDLEDTRGRGTLLDLAAAADLVIESFGPGAMQRLGLGLEALQARNPALSLVSISPWGGTA